MVLALRFVVHKAGTGSVLRAEAPLCSPRGLNIGTWRCTWDQGYVMLSTRLLLALSVVLKPLRPTALSFGLIGSGFIVEEEVFRYLLK